MKTNRGQGKITLPAPTQIKVKRNENIRKFATDQGYDCATGFLLGYPYFKENYNMIPIDLSKQKALDADSTAIQQINFIVNLDRAAGALFFSFLKKQKSCFRLFARNCVNALYINLI